MRVFYLLPIAVLGLLLSIASSTLTFANDAEDGVEQITMTPASSKISAAAGEAASGEFSVINSGDRTFDFIVYARPYSVETVEYTPNYSDTPVRSGAYAWVQFDAVEGRLAPGERKTINYTVNVPEDTAAGGHYAVLFAETQSQENDDQIVAQNKRVGSIMRLTVDGETREAGRVTSISTPWLQFSAPLESAAEIENSGNVDFDAESEMRISTIFGREVFKSKKSSVVYPGKPRKVTLQWDNPSWIGLYKVAHSVNVLGEEQVSEGYVLLIPRWFLMLLAIILFVGGIYGVISRRR